MASLAGDNLAILLFFISLAVTFAVAAMSQAGWKHRALISTLFLLAAVCFVVGVAWPWAKTISPFAEGCIVQVATNPVSWFVIVVMALTISMRPSNGLSSFRVRRRETIGQRQEMQAPILNQSGAQSRDDPSKMSDDELASHVSVFCLAMISTEAKENAFKLKECGRMDLFGMYSELKRTFDKDKRAILEEKIESQKEKNINLTALHYQRRLAEFNRKFAAHAVRLKVELARRTGRPINGQDDPTNALLSKHEINDESLQNLSSFLKEMSENLPNKKRIPWLD